jgi:AraC-like DNA-binding protein
MVVARRKLAGGQSPEEVASDLGFMSAPSFARQFQEFYKISPARYQADRATLGH